MYFVFLGSLLGYNKVKNQQTFERVIGRKARDLQTGNRLQVSDIFYVSLKRQEKAMAPHSSTLAWKIPWVEEPGRLQSMGSRRVGHD